MKEILTLQFGEFSNYVGSHYWNMQAEEYDRTRNVSPALFRSYGRKFIPRMISCSFNGSYNETAFRSPNTQLPNISTWEGAEVQTIQSETFAPTQYQALLAEEQSNLDQKKDLTMDLSQVPPDYNLTEETRVWSDFLRCELAPKSIFELSLVPHTSEAAMNQLGSFSNGKTLFEDVYECDELLDRIRWMVEECDSLGGVQLFNDAEGLYSGISHTILTHFKDDFSSNVPIFTYNLSSSIERNEYHIFNEAYATAQLSSLSDLLLPMSSHEFIVNRFPYIKTNKPNWFQSSAIIGASIDTMTRGYHYTDKIKNGCGMSSVAKHLGRVAGVSASLPFSPNMLIDIIHDSIISPSEDTPYKQLHQLKNVVSLTENMETKFYPSNQATIVRGISNETSKQEFIERAKELPKNCKIENISNLEDLFNYYFLVTNPQNVLLTYDESPVRVPPAFPHPDYSLNCEFVTTQDERIKTMPTLMHLQSGRNVRESLQKMSNAIKRANKLPLIDESLDDISFVQNYLQDLVDDNEGE